MRSKPERKSDKVRRLVADGRYKEALRIAKDFHLGISREDSDTMKRGYEYMVWPDFYRQIGKAPSEISIKAIETVQRLYGIKSIKE